MFNNTFVKIYALNFELGGVIDDAFAFFYINELSCCSVLWIFECVCYISKVSFSDFDSR